MRNLEFRVQSILNVEEASAFDLIICIDVLEHIPENIEAFIRLAKALKPNGYAFHAQFILTKLRFVQKMNDIIENGYNINE